MRENAYDIILVRYGSRWHSDSLRLVRYGLSECHLNPYRTRMDTICISSGQLHIKTIDEKTYAQNINKHMSRIYTVFAGLYRVKICG